MTLTFLLGGDLPVHRVGCGAMRLCGQPGNFGPYPDWEAGKRLLRRAAVTAPHRVWPTTRISFAPATAPPYPALPRIFRLVTFPARSASDGLPGWRRGQVVGPKTPVGEGQDSHVNVRNGPPGCTGTAGSGIMTRRGCGNP